MLFAEQKKNSERDKKLLMIKEDIENQFKSARLAISKWPEWKKEYANYKEDIMIECKKCNGTGHILEYQEYTKIDIDTTEVVYDIKELNKIRHCDECNGFGRFNVSKEVRDEVELHNEVRQIITDYIGDGDAMRECVDKIIDITRYFYKNKK